MSNAWQQGNLTRSQLSQEALGKGFQARNESAKLMHDRIRQLMEMGYGASQNAEQRKLTRQMPNLEAQGEINKAEGLKKLEWKARFGGNTQLPGAQGVPATGQAVGQELPESVQMPTQKPMTEAEPVQRETVVGNLTKFSGGSGQTPESIAKEKTGNAADAQNLVYYEYRSSVPITPDNMEGMKKVLDARGQIKAGIQVDASKLGAGSPVSNAPETAAAIKAGLVGKETPSGVKTPIINVPGMETDEYRRFMEANKPQEAANVPIEMPPNVQIPGKEPGIPTPFAQTEPGKQVKQFSWQEEAAPGYGLQLDEQAMSLKEREDYSAQVKWAEKYVDDHFTTYTPEQKYYKVLELTKGYRPIDYSGQGGKDADQKLRDEEGTMQKYIRKYGASFIQSPNGKKYFDIDMDTGGYKLKDVSKGDEALDAMAKYIASIGEPGQSHFWKFTDRGDWKQAMMNIQNPPKGMTKEQAIEKWKDTVKGTLSQEMYQILKPVDKTAENGEGPGIFTTLHELAESLGYEGLPWRIEKAWKDKELIKELKNELKARNEVGWSAETLLPLVNDFAKRKGLQQLTLADMTLARPLNEIR